MSGSLAAALTGAVTAALDLTTMAEPVSLGGFVFQGFEVPEMVNFGGSQTLTVHKLIGGIRVIDAMGADDADIKWSGIFLSPDASTRADALDQMRKAGEVQELIFGDRYYLVVVADFQAEMRLLYHIPYTITCTVLSDLSETVPGVVSPLQSIMDDVNSALGFNVTGALAQAQAALAPIQTYLVPLVAVTAGTGAATALASGLGSVSGLVSGAAAAASGQIGGLAQAALTAGNLVGATTAIGAASALQAATAAAGVVAGAASLSAYVGRAANTVAQA